MKKELLHTKLAKWFTQYPGKYLLQYEQDLLNPILHQLHGYYLIQLGAVDNYDLSAANMVPEHICMGRVTEYSDTEFSNLKLVESNFIELPLQHESIDIFFLPHVLEFSKCPRKLLKEIYNILIPGGKMIIFGFNPFSLWGLRIPFKSKKSFPWGGTFLSMGHVKYLLHSLGFMICAKHKFFFRPLTKNKLLLDKLVFLDPIGQLCFPFWGACYMLVVEKKVTKLTPLKVKRITKKIRITSGYPEPSMHN